MNKYLELKKRHEKLVNNFPAFYAFDESQLKEGLKRLNTNKESIISIGYGGFIKRSDKDKYIDLMTKINKENHESMKDETYLFEAFRYELGNHEFCITYDYEDTLNSIGLTYDKLSDNQIAILEKAKEDYLANCNY